MQLIYLDNSATTYPKPDRVISRVAKIMAERGGNPGRGSHRMSIDAMRIIFESRESIARAIDAPDAARISFTKNATEAINVVLKGMLSSGDHVVTTSFEHNSVVRTLWALSNVGVEVSKVEGSTPGLVTVEEIEEAMTDSTALVTVTHASNVFGTLQPIEDIGALCRSRGVPFMVDAAQTVGAMPMDVEAMNVDILAATGHKALFGPQGTGFLYVREGIEPPALIEGGTGEVTETLELPDRLEAGTVNTPGIGGLGEGAEFVLEEGLDAVRTHDVMLVERLIDGLGAISGVRLLGTTDATKRAALVSFTIEGVSPSKAGMKLDVEYSILARCGIHCSPDAHRRAGTHPEGAIRLSPSYLNTIDDIESAVSAVEKIAAGVKG